MRCLLTHIVKPVDLRCRVNTMSTVEELVMDAICLVLMVWMQSAVLMMMVMMMMMMTKALNTGRFVGIG